MPGPLFRLNTRPGIRRDVQLLDNDFYTDGEWVRFFNQRPKKIGGYRRLASADAVRGLATITEDGLVYTHFGTSDALLQAVNNKLGMGSASNDRTPALDFTPSADNLWTLDLFRNLAGTDTYLLAHPGQNLNNIDSQVETPVFYGSATGSSVLTTVQHVATATDQVCSGGVLAVPPYVFIFGNDGIIKNCKANDLGDWVATGASDANDVRAAKTKVVAGRALVGGGASPSALFWSLDGLIRASYVGGGQVFRYDTVGEDLSIISSRAVVSDSGVFYWPGVDRFYMTSGGPPQHLQNPFNGEWFFTHLNWEHRQKIFGVSVKRYNEIWWYFPKDDATECNHAIVYNTVDKFWYDTPTPVRTCGVSANAFQQPILGADDGLWLHEYGVDKVDGSQVLAIKSSFTTNEIGLASGGPTKDAAQGVDRWTELNRVEPDFEQVGSLRLEYLTREYPRDADAVTLAAEFDATTQTVDEPIQARVLRLRITSNESSGDYTMGSTMLHIGAGDE